MENSIRLSERARSPKIVGLLLTVIILSLLLLGVVLTSPAQAAVSYSAEEIAFVQLVNEYRAGNGLQPLLVSDLLSESADRHSSDMAKYGFFSHYTQKSDWFAANAAPWDRMAACGYDYNTHQGENIAAGYATAAAVLAGWKSSPGHNAAMLSPDYKVIGVSLVYAGGTKYSFYWTTDFGGYVDSTARSLSSSPSTTTTARPTTTTTKPVTTTTTVRPATTTTTTTKPATTTTTPSTAVATNIQFSDVKSNTLYSEAIYLLASQGVVGGYADGRFGPYDQVTRQQFAKMIVLAMGYQVSPVSACSFKDVPSSTNSSDPLYPAGYIIACASAGITVGKTPDTFGPYDKITRAQLITMVARAAALGEAPSWYKPVFGEFSVTHYPWAKKAAFAGLLDGFAGMGAGFDFWACATRAEVCLVLANLMGR